MSFRVVWKAMHCVWEGLTNKPSYVTEYHIVNVNGVHAPLQYLHAYTCAGVSAVECIHTWLCRCVVSENAYLNKQYTSL